MNASKQRDHLHLLPMASCSFHDIWVWIQNLPPVTQWKTNSMSICIFSSKSTQATLNLAITKNLQNHNPSVSFSIIADINIHITLWTSKSFKLNAKTPKILDDETVPKIFSNFINDVINYGPKKSTSFLHIPSVETINNFKDIFNLSFFTLTLFISIYEVPQDFRLECLKSHKNHLLSSYSKETVKILMRLLGSNIEEQWMRSLNLAITNWIVELEAENHILRTPSPLFSYAISTVGLWKVQLFCPIIAMDMESSNGGTADERLQFSLRYNQLQGVIQFGHKVIPKEKWVDVIVNVDNIRCDVIRLVSETLMAEQGAGSFEKHFPSRISLQLTPLQTNVLSVSVSKSSENPVREIGLEKTIEGSFDPPNSFGIRASAGESMTMSLKPWKFEESIYGYSANLNWFLHDSVDGREVFSSNPSRISLIQPKAWFKNRYSSAYRPFTRQGGVVFAGDEYGDKVLWKLDRRELGKTMEWEIKGRIWLTYLPNKHRTFYNETRSLEFTDILHLSLV